MDGRRSLVASSRGRISEPVWSDCLAASRSTPMNSSSRVALESHLPEALIQRVPSDLIEVLPLLAWTSSGSLPTRAESARRATISRSNLVETSSRLAAVVTNSDSLHYWMTHLYLFLAQSAMDFSYDSWRR